MRFKEKISRDTHLVLTLRGALGGLIGGIAFSGISMWFLADQGMSPTMTFRMIATIVQDDALFESGEASVPLGIAIHLALSVVYGATLGLLAPEFRGDAGRAWAAITHGILLYCLNFLVLSPLLYPTFQQANQPLMAVSHVLFAAFVIPFITRWDMHKEI